MLSSFFHIAVSCATVKISLRRIIREPLLQFLVAGFAIFVVAQLVSGDRQRDARTIVIDDTLVRFLTNLHTAQFGVEPDAATRERLIASYVREEVLYREALRRGLDRDDDIIRRRLAQKLEYLLAGTEPEPPITAALRAYYDAHVDQYTQPGGVTFEHRYFRGDRPGAAERAAAALVALTTSSGSGVAPEADPFPLADRYDDLTPGQARQLFGDSEFVRHLFSAPLGAWSGPTASGYGLHLVRISARTPDTPLPFAAVEASVREAYLRETSDRAVADALQVLIAQHRIERRDTNRVTSE